jgi:hypothetical protein
MSRPGVRLGDKNPPRAVAVLGDRVAMAGGAVMAGGSPRLVTESAAGGGAPQLPLASRGAEIRGK